jgi:diguanylate cyclase (GGDEF)-like protein
MSASPRKPARATLRRRFSNLVRLVLSLQFKATALVVVLTLTVTCVVAAYLLRTSGRVASEEHGRQLLASAGLLAKAAAPLMERDWEQLAPLARSSANGNPLMYVLFSSADGETVAKAEHGQVGLVRGLQLGERFRSPSPGTPLLYSNAQDVPLFMDVLYPIVRSEDDAGGGRTQLLGYVRVGMVANHWQESMSSTLDMLIGIGSLALVAVVPLGFLLIRRIIRPIEGLAQTMLNFSTGKLDVRSPIRSVDEIGQLAQAFNQMADQHQQTHMRIVRLNAELEERVAYRTHQLRELASRDPLTGLYNRRYFSDVLERCYAEATRYRTDLSCIMIDLDDFKSANDAFGHQVGDQVLQLAAGTIVGQLRTADVAARYGGDEFILLLPQTDSDRAQILGQRIIERFNNELKDRFPPSTVRMSMGIASLNNMDAHNAEALIQAADHALYTAKTAGKNRIIVMTAPAA